MKKLMLLIASIVLLCACQSTNKYAPLYESDKYENITMGMNINGTQTKLCEVSVPNDYLISAAYTTDNNSKEIYGTVHYVVLEDYKDSLKDIVLSDISIRKDTSSEIVISYDNSLPNHFDINVDKEDYPDGTSFEINGHEGYYFLTESYLLMDIDLGEDVIMWVTYSDPNLDRDNIEPIAKALINTIHFN